MSRPSFDRHVVRGRSVFVAPSGPVCFRHPAGAGLKLSGGRNYPQAGYWRGLRVELNPCLLKNP